MLEIDEPARRATAVRAPRVRGVSFEVDEGEIVGVVGANGAGKTTTLAAISGSSAPAAGSIEFDGEAARGACHRSGSPAAGISLVPEGRRIFNKPHRRGEPAHGRDRAERPGRVRRRHRRVLERFPVLARYYKSTAGNLSGGEQQQLAIARALLARPRLLVLDEPSLGLAPVDGRARLRHLAELREEGVTILLVEQNAARAVELADRCLVLRQGRSSPPAHGRNCRTPPTSQTAYLGPRDVDA